MRHKGLCTWGVQTATKPFAAGLADFVQTNFQLPDLYTGGPISYYHRAENVKKGFTEKL